MTTVGRLLIVIEELLFAYAVYAVLFDIFYGWWDHFTLNDFEEHLVLLIFVIVFIVVLIMCQLCFIITAASDPGYIVAYNADRSMPEIKPPATYPTPKRSCKTCLVPKPDRAHHCRRCNKCVLKMDHHCYFVNNCIGFYNYKYFFNFLCWMQAFCILVIAIVIYDGIVNFDDEVIRYTGLVAGILSIAAFIFVFRLFYYHCKFITYGVTTIEHEEKKLKGGNMYDKGCGGNCVEVFGKNPCGWCVPYWSSLGNGTTFETRETETTPIIQHYPPSLA